MRFSDYAPAIKNAFLCVSVFAIFAAPTFAQAPAERSDTLAAGFSSPPPSAGIRCFWWWLNGNVTQASITRDLEQMKAKGFSGALVFDADGSEQGGNTGVPAGPTFGSPEWRALFKHAVQEAHRLGLALSLSIQSGWNLGGPDVPAAEAAKILTWSEVDSTGDSPVKLPQPPTKDGFYRDIAVLAYPTKALNAGVLNAAQRRPVQNLRAKAVFSELGASTPDTRFLLDDVPGQPGEEDCQVSQIVNLSAKMASDGTLNWKPGTGSWHIMRFGYTCSGAQVSTASGKWQGRVIDHLSAEPLRRYWKRNIDPILDDLDPSSRKALQYVHTDSWEHGGANWTDDFASQFRRRRGYDPIPYLPIVTGKILDDRETGNRFLADLRKTIGDCVAENHYATLSWLAKARGMGIHPESAGPHAGPFDGIKDYGRSDIVLSEFWVPSPHRPNAPDRYFVKQAASAAHIYGQKLVGAEAFTSIGPHWNDTLWKSQKPSFDHELCAGLNLVFAHTFTSSPAEMGLPGQEYFAGTHFNPQVTWWSMADAYTLYLRRCQFLMQQGRVVTDVLYYYGDHVPNIAGYKQADPAKVLPGFDYDIVDEEVLLRSLRVEKGWLTLPSGCRYRLLVLPNHKVLSLAALEKVEKLVKAGATVVGPKTERIVSLSDGKTRDEELKRISTELWGNDPSAAEKKVGKGRVVWSRGARDVLLDDGIAPDFEIEGNAPGNDYIHRQIGSADVYFVSNQTDKPVDLKAIFRISGRQPELWDALTGEQRLAGAFHQESGRTAVPLSLNAFGSVFVVFRNTISAAQQGEAVSNQVPTRLVSELSGPWEVHFDPRWGGPEKVTFDQLQSWTRSADDGVKYYSGIATYKKIFDAPAGLLNQKLYLELGDIRDVGIARVRVNGLDCGVTWTPPFRVDVTKALKSGSNVVEIEVANSWRNRLIGDSQLPVNKQLTKTNIAVKPDWKLEESGLLGPVRLVCDTLP